MPKKGSDKLFLMDGVDLESRTIMLDDNVDDGTVGVALRALRMMEQSSSEPVTLILNTGGGDVYDGLALYDALRASPCHIITLGVGKVMSMGTVLLLAGDEKLSYPNTTFMWHTVSAGAVGKAHELATEVQETTRLLGLILDIYAERTPIKRKVWQQWLRHEDRYGGVTKALELGMIDRVIGNE